MAKNKTKKTITAIFTLLAILLPVDLPAQPKKQIDLPQMIILITLDTVRSDHTTYMGYPRNTTPFLDDLSSKGVLLKKMRTPIPFTTPSHEAIFSSLDPQHQDPDLYQRFIPILNSPEPKKLRPIENDPTQQTLPQILKKKGYQTAAFTAASFMDIFKKRFDHFDIPENREKKVDHHTTPRYTAEQIVNNAITWIQKKDRKHKQFIWLHFFDAHYPYIRAIPYKAAANDPDNDTMLAYWQEKQGSHHEIFKEPRQENIIDTFNNYDGALQYIDSQIKRFHSYITTHTRAKKILWIIVPDHGEGLTSHLYYNHHKRLYEEQLLTPAIIVYQGRFTHHIDICDATNTDLMPTVAQIIQYPLSNRQTDGNSILERLNKESICHPTEKTAIATRQVPKIPFYIPKIKSKLPIEMPDEGQPPSIAIYNAPYKYIYNTNGDQQLYDIEKDPSETKNLITDDPSLTKKMLEKAQEIYAKNITYWQIQEKPNDTQTNITDKDKKRIQQLRSLGY